MTKIGKLIFNRFFGVLSQPLHPESNLRHFHSYYLFFSALPFFLKTSLGVRSNLKLIFALSLKSLPVI